MAQYSIKDLEEISNTKAHTIRIWESRYGLFSPQRTETNIRYYDDQQLKKLLNVCALMNQGMKISKISELSEKQINDEIENIITKSLTGDIHLETIINQILIAVSTFDELLFEKVFSNAILRFGFKDTYIKIIYPLLIRIGLMWTKDDIMPAQEHFLSNIIKQKLFAAIDAYPIPQNSNQKWLLFLPETENHEIGLLMATYVLRSHGKSVIYLGQAVPYENLSKVISSTKPTHLYTFFIRNQPEEEINELLKGLVKDHKNVILCVSGKQALLEPTLQKSKINWVKDIDSLIALTKN